MNKIPEGNDGFIMCNSRCKDYSLKKRDSKNNNTWVLESKIDPHVLFSSVINEVINSGFSNSFTCGIRVDTRTTVIFLLQRYK